MMLKLYRGHDNRLIAIEPAAVGTLNLAAMPGAVMKGRAIPEAVAMTLLRRFGGKLITCEAERDIPAG